MSLLIKIEKGGFLRQLNRNKETAASIFTFLLFLAISAIIIKDINPVKENIPNYFELSKNPYVKYEKLLDRTDLKKIMDNRQFFEMKYDENIIKRKDPFIREDPFIMKMQTKRDNEKINSEN